MGYSSEITRFLLTSSTVGSVITHFFMHFMEIP